MRPMVMVSAPSQLTNGLRPNQVRDPRRPLSVKAKREGDITTLDATPVSLAEVIDLIADACRPNVMVCGVEAGFPKADLFQDWSGQPLETHGDDVVTRSMDLPGLVEVFDGYPWRARLFDFGDDRPDISASYVAVMSEDWRDRPFLADLPSSGLYAAECDGLQNPG
jgi:hypothetical protein